VTADAADVAATGETGTPAVDQSAAEEILVTVGEGADGPDASSDDEVQG